MNDEGMTKSELRENGGTRAACRAVAQRRRVVSLKLGRSEPDWDYRAVPSSQINGQDARWLHRVRAGLA
jgi:hypothetical protein